MKFKSIFIALLMFLACPTLADQIQIGEFVPDFKLINQNGEETSLSDFKGKGVVISFLYTQCPFPEKCAMIGKKLRSLAELTATIGAADDVQVLAITIDPKNDTPEHLKKYAQGFDEKHRNWQFLTGSENDIAQVAGAFGVLYWDEGGVIQHNMRTLFIDPDGILRVARSGSEWRTGEFAAKIKPHLASD
jgi:protein SCO1/2